jgi:hypothetical protein
VSKKRQEAAKTALTNAGVKSKVADKIVAQAASTGKQGLSKNELAYIKKFGGDLKGKTVKQVNAKTFLTSYDERKRKLSNNASSSENNVSNFSSQIDYTTSSVFPTPSDTIVRTPTRDVVEYSDNNDIPVELISNLLFENLAANELIKYERHDTIEGTNVSYDIISNLSAIRKQFDPSTLISRQKPDTSYFDIYNIKLEDKIPGRQYLLQNNLEEFYYIDTNGDLVIELDNMNPDELVEVEIDSSGTIYKVQL